LIVFKFIYVLYNAKSHGNEEVVLQAQWILFSSERAWDWDKWGIDVDDAARLSTTFQ